MVSIKYSEAITETLDILNHTRKEDVDKIPPKFMDFLNANASKTYKPQLDHTKKIKDMELKRKTKVILAIIYKKFWCNSEKREQFNRALKKNEIKREKELREKYNSDNIFKNKKEEKVVENANLPTEIKEKTIFKKLISFIKRLFNKTN